MIVQRSFHSLIKPVLVLLSFLPSIRAQTLPLRQSSSSCNHHRHIRHYLQVWVASSEDLTKLAAAAALVKPLLTGRHQGSMYFLWPCQSQDAQHIPSGYVDLPNIMAALQATEAAGIPTRFPHPSHLYKVSMPHVGKQGLGGVLDLKTWSEVSERSSHSIFTSLRKVCDFIFYLSSLCLLSCLFRQVFLSKDWTSQLCLFPDMRVPATTKVRILHGITYSWGGQLFV